MGEVALMLRKAQHEDWSIFLRKKIWCLKLRRAATPAHPARRVLLVHHILNQIIDHGGVGQG